MQFFNRYHNSFRSRRQESEWEKKTLKYSIEEQSSELSSLTRERVSFAGTYASDARQQILFVDTVSLQVVVGCNNGTAEFRKNLLSLRGTERSRHDKGLRHVRPTDACITTAALYFIGVLFCCAACLEVSSAPEESPILHRGPQARRVNTTTTLLVARARTQTCSYVHSVCSRRHVSPSPALMLFAPIACMHAFCRTTADTLKNPTKILVPCKPRYIPLECIR